MKATHTTIYTADDGTEYTDARLCAAHEQVLAKGEHAYGTMGFETARDALAATSPTPIVLDRGSLMRALAVTVAMAMAAAQVVTLCRQEGWK